MSSKAKMKEEQTYRLQSTLPESDYLKLAQWAESEGSNITSVIRKLIRNESFFRKLQDEGQQLLVEDKKGEIMRVIIRD